MVLSCLIELTLDVKILKHMMFRGRQRITTRKLLTVQSVYELD
ncbi:hypothetical protein C5167_029255 [Papaver somniferum]|nr:hypothetical protein C5167_029255 [Papaver somniferum]